MNISGGHFIKPMSAYGREPSSESDRNLARTMHPCVCRISLTLKSYQPKSGRRSVLIMAIVRNNVSGKSFNRRTHYRFKLRLKDFEMGMQDVYDFFYDVNRFLVGRGLLRLDDTLRPAIMSGLLADMLTSSMGNGSNLRSHSSQLTDHWRCSTLPSRRFPLNDYVLDPNSTGSFAYERGRTVLLDLPELTQRRLDGLLERLLA